MSNDFTITGPITGLPTSCETVSENVRKCPALADHLIERSPVTLTEKQKAAVELMVLGRSMAATAQAIEVDARTLYRWRQLEAFQEALDDRRRELWASAGDRLASMVHPSLDVLQQHLEDNYDRARFRAAATVLRLAKLKVI